MFMAKIYPPKQGRVKTTRRWVNKPLPQETRKMMVGNKDRDKKTFWLFFIYIANNKHKSVWNIAVSPQIWDVC